ncbi:MAG: hypothetical protein ACO3A2_01695 [Bdellovibrionia bacterium]
MKYFHFIFKILCILGYANASAQTHCFIITGEGIYRDERFQAASPLLAQEPFNQSGRCKKFGTWRDFIRFFEAERNQLSVDDQVFITQAVHGSPGGRASDCPSPEMKQFDEFKTVEDYGGTGPNQIIHALESIAKTHRVAFHNMSCHGGSLLAQYLQKHNQGDLEAEIESKLCIFTDSAQGRTSSLRHGREWQKIDLSGKSITDLIKMTITGIQLEHRPLGGDELPMNSHMGLISSANMSVLELHQSLRSSWEGRVNPMVIHHKLASKGWSGAYSSCRSEDQPIVPVYGLDGFVESLFKELDRAESESVTNREAILSSLEEPPMNERHKLRRQACDEFKF